MKRLTGIIGCWLALLVLFNAEHCRAGLCFLASAGNDVTMSEVQGQMITPNLDEVWDADKAHDQTPSALNNLSNRNTASDDTSSTDMSGSRTRMADSADELPKKRANSDSPLQQYLLIVLLIGAIGLVMISAGVAQWWRRRSIRQNWLFPMVQEGGQSSVLPAALPAPLIAKKQQLESSRDKKTKKPAQRRAA